MKYSATRLLASFALGGDGRKWTSPDEIETTEAAVIVRRWVKGDLRKREETLPYSRVASVRVKPGLRTASLVIETTGAGAVEVPGLPREVADAAAKDIASRIA